jgi:hypothetical protein
MRHLLFFLLCLRAFAPTVSAQPGFCGAPYSTFYSANAFFPINLYPTLDGTLLPFGSHIIAIYGVGMGNGAAAGCAGFIQWNGTNTVMAVNGDDGSLPGYQVSEPYRFLVQLPNGCLIDSIVVTYDTSGIYTNPGFFQDGGLSRLASFHAFHRDWLEVVAQPGQCSAEAAMLTAQPNGFGGPFQFHWNNGDTIPSLSSLADGNYQVTVTDAFGCSLTDVGQAMNFPGPSLTLQSEPEIGEVTCQSLATASDGTAPFTFLWSNGQTDSLATTLPDGPFSVTVTDANGCTAEQSDVCMTVSTDEMAEAQDWNIQPNPTTGWVQVSAMTQPSPATVLLSDFSGKTLLRQSCTGFSSALSFDLNYLPAGLYLLRILSATNASSKTFKLIKQ